MYCICSTECGIEDSIDIRHNRRYHQKLIKEYLYYDLVLQTLVDMNENIVALTAMCLIL